MDERIRRAVGDEPAWVVGGALRDELLGREIVDVDVACPSPELAARLYARLAGGAVFPLSERHGAWRVAFRGGSTVDFTPLHGETIEEDLATRDFTVNALARPAGRRRAASTRSAARPTWRRAGCAPSAPSVFADDPLRLLRAVRLEDELGFRLDEATEELVRGVGGPGRRAGRRAASSASSSASPRTASGAPTSSACSSRSAARSRASSASTRRTRRASCWSRVFGDGLRALPDLQRPPQARAHAARRGAARRRLAARDPPLPPPHGALGALGARLPRRDRPLRRRRAPRAPPTPPSRSCAARTCSSWASSRARRSAACSSWSPRSAPSGRSRRARRRSSSSGAS